MKNDVIADVYGVEEANKLYSYTDPRWSEVYNKAFNEKLEELTNEQTTKTKISYSEQEVFDLMIAACKIGWGKRFFNPKANFSEAVKEVMSYLDNHKKQ